MFRDGYQDGEAENMEGLHADENPQLIMRLGQPLRGVCEEMKDEQAGYEPAWPAAVYEERPETNGVGQGMENAGLPVIKLRLAHVFGIEDEFTKRV